MKVRYYGHNGSGTGYGRAADEMVEALVVAGAEVEVRPLSPASTWNRDLAVSRFFKTDAELSRPDAIIVHTLPLDVAKVIATLGHADIDVPTVAYTTWEAVDVPDAVIRSVAEANALWVPSTATLHAFEDELTEDELSQCTYRVMPHAFDDSIDRRYTGDIPKDKRFSFYYVGAWTARKNPAALIRTFCRTFTKDDPVELLLQCRGLPKEQFLGAMWSTGIPQTDWPNVRFSNQELTEPQLWMLHAVGDVFVSASHGEAWNLPAFEAMLAGRHAIVPYGQGSDDYLDDTSAHRYASRLSPAQVDVRVVPPPPDAPPGSVNLQVMAAQGLTSRCHWQDPDLEELGVRMRMAYQLRLRTLDVHYDVAAEFGRKAVGQRAMTYLQEMMK